MLAEILAYNKLALCRSASAALSVVLGYIGVYSITRVNMGVQGM